jgi:hypothetical protein
LLVSNYPPSTDEELTNKPTRTNRQTWEAPLSYRLLTDKRIAMSKPAAERLAKAHPFDEVRDAVAHWYINRVAKFGDHPGIVIHWLDNSDEFIIPTLAAEFRRSDIWRDYRTPDEIAEDEANERAAAERLAQLETGPPGHAQPPDEPPPDPGTPAGAWRLLQAEHSDHLRRATLLDHDSERNTFIVAAPADRIDWLRTRLARQAERKLTVITGRPATVEFTVSQETQGATP